MSKNIWKRILRHANNEIVKEDKQQNSRNEKHIEQTGEVTD